MVTFAPATRMVMGLAAFGFLAFAFLLLTARLMAAGVVLFVVTLLINFAAGYIVNKAQPWRK